ncbi:hypothetical protein [Microcoleus sp. S13_C3]
MGDWELGIGHRPNRELGIGGRDWKATMPSFKRRTINNDTINN